MRPNFFKAPFSPFQSSPAREAGPSQRSHEAGGTSSTDKSDKPASRFKTPGSPSRLAAGFNKLFGNTDEAKEQLKETANEILSRVEHYVGKPGSLDEKTKKKLNSSLRKALTADELGMLGKTLRNAGRNIPRTGTMAHDLSAMTKNLISGTVDKNQFMSKVSDASQKLEQLAKERTAYHVANHAVTDKLGTLYAYDPAKHEEAFAQYSAFMSVESYPECTKLLKKLDAHLESVLDSLRTPLERAVRTELESLQASKQKRTYEVADEKYNAVMSLGSPEARQAKLEEFARVLKSVNAWVKESPDVSCFDYVDRFNPFPSRPSRDQAPPRSGPPPQRRQAATRPRPQAMPEAASTSAGKAAYWTGSVAYGGSKLSMKKFIPGTRELARFGPAEGREHASALTKNLSADQLKELHSDLLALSNTATNDMKNAFDKKYKNVFDNRFDDNPAAFAVLGKAGLSRCGGDAKQSSFWSVPSTHTPQS